MTPKDIELIKKEGILKELQDRIFIEIHKCTNALENSKENSLSKFDIEIKTAENRINDAKLLYAEYCKVLEND